MAAVSNWITWLSPANWTKAQMPWQSPASAKAHKVLAPAGGDGKSPKLLLVPVSLLRLVTQNAAPRKASGAAASARACVSALLVLATGPSWLLRGLELMV